ncbi:DSBA oxidoreductase [Paenibacillus baekrokdamisoli]|uniref:DSBA oxidoreductase n=1 Tax=Paenibacillus baekrokdamisoli TaxID=1712516 RepID=A0A3G9JI93_9BACL|nr:DsbA family oxidoreductase [Paenibacillus baekrokdamisoli]MBB3068976.1 putative DsbA family dithiol-disulfide isomerase [Paenibacillus baekrokdamisoli]BBH23798.1 DSBA oxidoreductase [Paenibacillus baekrokdamisoli]
MHIDLYSDVVCPWCRIGKQNLFRALKQWEAKGGEPVTITYKAYQLDPNLPEEGRSFDEVMQKKMGGAETLQRMLEHVTKSGAAVGVTFRFDRVTRMPNTRLAHRFIALVPEESKTAAVDSLFRATFEEGRDVAQLSEVLAVAIELGLDEADIRTRLLAGEGSESVDADIEQAHKIGVTGVPYFVFNNKYALSGAYPADELIGLMERVATGE